MQLLLLLLRPLLLLLLLVRGFCGTGRSAKMMVNKMGALWRIYG